MLNVNLKKYPWQIQHIVIGIKMEIIVKFVKIYSQL